VGSRIGQNHFGSSTFGYKSFERRSSKFAFKNLHGADTTRQLNRAMPPEAKFRPQTELKDFGLLSDYDYASLWCRWRRGYELYMYADQAFVGMNYTFRYYISGTQNLGPAIPGAVWMYPSMKQDMAMHVTTIRPRDVYNFLDYGLAIQSVTTYSEGILAVVLNGNFGPPVTYFIGEVLSDRFNADGTEKTSYGNYTLVNVGTDGVIADPSTSAHGDHNTLFLANGTNTSWSVIDSNTLSAPAASNPTPGDYLTTEYRYSCSCPDYVGREDFNLYKYNTKRIYPYTLPQDLKPGTYDPGGTETGPERLQETRDYPGAARDFGFIYVNTLLKAPEYKDDGKTFSDPNMYFYMPKWCKHLYASFFDLRNRLPATATVINPWLDQPADEPMDGRYRQYFFKQLKKETDSRKRDKDLAWWEKYSPSMTDTPTHLMYPDMFPAVIKALNFDTAISGADSSRPIVASGFVMTKIGDYNPFLPISERDIIDGGHYEDGDLVPLASGLVAPLFNGGQYDDGVTIPPSIEPLLINGGVY